MHKLNDTKVNFYVVGKHRIVLINTRFDNLPAEIHDLLNDHVDIVLDEFPNELPPMRSINHHIYLIPRASFPYKVAYKMTPKENEEIRNQVKDLLDKGLVRESLILCGVAKVLIPKKDGGYRMCTYSKEIKKITIRYIFPLPRMDDLMDFLSGAKYFSNLELKSGYHHIRIREGDAWKITFKTNDGLYE